MNLFQILKSASFALKPSVPWNSAELSITDLQSSELKTIINSS
jgi:hypothetical protein